MKVIIDIDEYDYSTIINDERYMPLDVSVAIKNGTPIPDNATNGDVIKAIFGSDKVFGFIHYIQLKAKAGNWFNEGVVAEFNRNWWEEPYQKGGKE